MKEASSKRLQTASLLYEILFKRQNYGDSGGQRTRGEGRGLTTNGKEGTLGGDAYVLYLDFNGSHAGMYTTCVKTHQILHLKWVNFMLCKLYFNKADKNEEKQTNQKTLLVFSCPS